MYEVQIHYQDTEHVDFIKNIPTFIKAFGLIGECINLANLPDNPNATMFLIRNKETEKIIKWLH